MSTARRTLLTAAAAGVLLVALWFIPTAKANASPDTADGPHAAAPAAAPLAGTAATRSGQAPSAAPGAARAAYWDGTGDLAETGAFNTKPYVIGGGVFLGVGAGFVVYSVRKGREEES